MDRRLQQFAGGLPFAVNVVVFFDSHKTERLMQMETSQDSKPHERDRARARWRAGILATFSAIAFLIAQPTYADPDLWGHLRFGLDMIAARAFIFSDPYSYVTADVLWINHEWLAEVLTAAAWLSGQSTGLILMRLGIFGATVASILVYVNHSFRPTLVSLLVILCMVCTGLLLFSLVVRPQLFTFLLFAITLMVIREAETGRYRLLWTMPLVIALWTNLHGGVLAGMGILAIWGVLHLSINRPQWRKVLTPLLVSLLALLVNPYGYQLIAFLLETATVARPEIIDWQPLQIRSTFGAVYLATLAISVAAILCSNKDRNWTLLSLFGLTAVLPLSAVRHLPLMTIGAAILVGDHIAACLDRRVGSLLSSVRLQPRLAYVPLMLAGALVIVGIYNLPRRILVSSHIQYPSAALSLLVKSGFRGNLASTFDWGEYIIWHAGPDIQVSIDGRRETVYPPDVYQQNFDLWRGHNDWQALWREHPTDAALFDRGSAADNLLRLSPEWVLVFEDDRSVLFINAQSESLEAIQRAVANFTPPEPPLYFP